MNALHQGKVIQRVHVLVTCSDSSHLCPPLLAPAPLVQGNIINSHAQYFKTSQQPVHDGGLPRGGLDDRRNGFA